MIIASTWRAHQSGALQGFIDLELRPSGCLLLHGCTLMESNGHRWIGLPARPQLDRDGKQLIAPKTGKPSYSAIIDLVDRGARERFQEAALVAVDKLLGDGSAP
jgi:hypothetical protein